MFRVGSLDAPEWQQFGMIFDVAFDGAGNLYLLDFQAPRVVVVDQVGKLVRMIGGPGEGPGEVSFPGHLAAMADGRVVVGDIARDRALQVYGSDGDKVVRETITYAWAPPSAGIITLRVGGQEITTGDQTTPPPRTFDPGTVRGSAPRRRVWPFQAPRHTRSRSSTRDGAISRILSRPFHPQPVTDRILEAGNRAPDRGIRRATGSDERATPDRGGWEDRKRRRWGPARHDARGLGEIAAHLSRSPAVRGRGSGRPRRAHDLGGPDLGAATGRRWMAAIWGAIRATPPCRTPLVPDGLVAFVETDELGVNTVVVKRLTTPGEWLTRGPRRGRTAAPTGASHEGRSAGAPTQLPGLAAIAIRADSALTKTSKLS